LKPEIVIVGFFINDFSENVNDGNDHPYAYPRPAAKLSNGELEIRNLPVPKREELEHKREENGLLKRTLMKSRIVYFSAYNLVTGIQNFMFRIGQKEVTISDDFGEMLNVSAAILRNMDEFLEDSELYVFTIPVKGQKDKPAVSEQYQALCNKIENISCTDLSYLAEKEEYLNYHIFTEIINEKTNNNNFRLQFIINILKKQILLQSSKASHAQIVNSHIINHPLQVSAVSFILLAAITPRLRISQQHNVFSFFKFRSTKTKRIRTYLSCSRRY